MGETYNNDPYYDFDEIIVNGCLVEPGTVYEIVAKEPTMDEPQFYKEVGSVKETHPWVDNTLYISQHDTGFYAGSPVFNKTSFKNDFRKRGEMSEKYFQIFALPLKNYISDIEKIRVPTEDEFFDKFYTTKYSKVDIKPGLQLNTANPVDRFKLYIAIIEGFVIMKGKREDFEKKEGLRDEKDISNVDAQYAYISVNERKNRNEQNAELTLEANYQYMNLMMKDKSLLVDILSYISIPVSSSASKGELANIFSNTMSHNKDKMRQFLDEIKRLDKSEGEFQKELEILNILKTKKGRAILSKEGSAYYMGETPMGSNMKSIAATLLKNDELLREFYVLLDSK